MTMARPNDQQAIAGHVQGLREARAAFQALPEIVRDRTLEGREKTAFAIVSRAKVNLQRSPSVQTRTLYNHVAYKVTKSSGRVRAGIMSGTTTITVGGKKVRVKGVITAGRGGSALTSRGAKKVQPTRYGPKVEFGTKHMKAEPFMTPARDAEKQPHIERMAAAGKLIERDMAAVGMRGL